MYTGLSGPTGGYPWEKDYGAKEPAKKTDPCTSARQIRAQYPDSWKMYVPRQYWDCSEPGWLIRQRGNASDPVKADWDAAGKAGGAYSGGGSSNSGKSTGNAAGSATNMGKGAGGGSTTKQKTKSSSSKSSYDPQLDPLLPPAAQGASAGAGADDGGGIPLWLIIAGAAIGGVVLANQLSKKR